MYLLAVNNSEGRETKECQGVSRIFDRQKIEEEIVSHDEWTDPGNEDPEEFRQLKGCKIRQRLQLVSTVLLSSYRDLLLLLNLSGYFWVRGQVLLLIDFDPIGYLGEDIVARRGVTLPLKMNVKA